MPQVQHTLQMANSSSGANQGGLAVNQSGQTTSSSDQVANKGSYAINQEIYVS